MCLGFWNCHTSSVWFFIIWGRYCCVFEMGIYGARCQAFYLVKLRWSFHLPIQKAPSLIQVGKNMWEFSKGKKWILWCYQHIYYPVKVRKTNTASWNIHHFKTCVENTPTRQSFRCHSFWSFQTSTNSGIWWNSLDYCLICSQFFISLSFCMEQLVIP